MPAFDDKWGQSPPPADLQQSVYGLMKRQGERLQQARKEAGYRSARAAAMENGWPESTYRSHENGTRKIGDDDAQRYVRRFRLKGASATAQFVMFGDGADYVMSSPALDEQDDHIESSEVAVTDMPDPPRKRMVRLVGYVGAGSAAHYYAVSDEDYEEVEAPPGATDQTVAVEIRGKSMGNLLDSWLVFYRDVRSPVGPELYGKVCVVGLADDRILVKKIHHNADGTFSLISNLGEPPIENARIEWAAAVTDMRPKDRA